LGWIALAQVCDQIGGGALPRAVALDHRQDRAGDCVAVEGRASSLCLRLAL
jgi:hypothetical protein